MRYFSTRDAGRSAPASFRDAVLRGLAPDGGLYVPETFPALPEPGSLGRLPFADLAFEIGKRFACPDLSEPQLADLVEDAYDFPVPIVELKPGRHALELFRGPTAAFKDFGARFMARAMGRFVAGGGRRLLVLTATSGDTGGAVADGFHGVDGIDVVVLYPEGRVSPLQERQIAGLGGNVRAVSIEGSFDDCQALVKRACADPAVAIGRLVTSANSINVARLIPQTFYYAYAACALDPDGRRGLVVSVPSGNYGNLTAGLYARAMGAPIASFVAAANANRAVPDYLATGRYEPRPSIATVSNAMDVGAPSNFERMTALHPFGELTKLVRGASLSDAETLDAIKKEEARSGYVLDPHGAVAWEALNRALGDSDTPGLACLTAHPAKFRDVVEPAIGRPVPLPPELEAAAARTPVGARMKPDYAAFLEYLRDATKG